MTPKEKAKELANKFIFKSVFDMTDLELIEASKTAKQFALIAVDEILNLMINNFKWDINYNGNIHYYEEVKQEIQAL